MSTIKVDNLQTTTGTGLYLAKSWCTVDQSGTQVLRDSENVSSITDSGSGYTDVTMSNAQPNAYYCISTYTATLGGGGNQHHTVVSRNYSTTTTTYRLSSLSNTYQTVDGLVGASIFS